MEFPSFGALKMYLLLAELLNLNVKQFLINLASPFLNFSYIIVCNLRQ